MEDSYIINVPAEYRISPQYKPSLSESHLNKYILEVDPLSFDENRASFAYKSPGLGVVQSPNVAMEFSLLIKSGRPISMLAQLGPQLQILDASPGASGVYVKAGNAATVQPTSGAKIAFASGDALQGAITSVQIICNGSALNQYRQRDYMRSLKRCWFSNRTFQRRFCRCGGTPQQYDCRAISGEVIERAGNAGLYDQGNPAPTHAISGFCGDSGVKDQLKNLLACTEEIVEDGTPANSDNRIIRVRW